MSETKKTFMNALRTTLQPKYGSRWTEGFSANGDKLTISPDDEGGVEYERAQNICDIVDRIAKDFGYAVVREEQPSQRITVTVPD